ncbi:regulator of g protein signaling domain containing protein [Entamoeba nuttalli P19]|uniref:Regulator of g protein signaling domain containing protein n=1 Tax=Entamoeba nuttalli (strain P19) TaxID=1076696 RepID=K2GG34_ENTNP|nr:regulator of g protein signaling domain containing protein [Entamoeba nuttalli P19]EKE41636.1 regulator of g protein signaling domain containing protein [Entamoeba nuttalli P19]|eukprot:XP_008856029.1 regulator of g protein signaling domain containing protein [Entamoeba nuttalli P19]
MSDKKKRGFKNEPTDTSSSSNLVYDKQFCEIFKKNVLNLVNDLKTLKETMKTAEALIHSINDQISAIYSNDGDSIIQDEVQQFLSSTEGISFKTIPLIQNELFCCESFYKELSKKLPRMSNEQIQCIANQRYDMLDPIILLYMKLVVNLTGEKAVSFKGLMYNAVQDGLSIPKTLKLLTTFKSIVESRIGSLYLEKYLKGTGEERNVQFFRSAFIYAKIKTANVREWVCRKIYEEFISVGSEKEISITQPIRNRIIVQYAQGCDKNIFEEAKNYVFQEMNSKNLFERFQASPCFKELICRVTPVLVDGVSATDPIEIPCEEETFVRVAKYLIPYNLVSYTEVFVRLGYTTPQIMSLLTEKEVDKLTTNDVDRGRLKEFCEICKENKLEQSKALTKEAITKVPTIQENFIKYAEHTNGNIKNTLAFLNYIKNTEPQQMTVSQILTRAEMAFVELKSKHHVAYRLLKKCDDVQEMQPLLPQCQNALVSLLLDEQLEEYNVSNFWKPQTRSNAKVQKQSSKVKLSKTPELINEPEEQIKRSITPLGSESLHNIMVDDIVGEDEDIKSTNFLVASCRRATEKDLRLSLQYNPEDNIIGSQKTETKINQIITKIKGIILPKLSKMKTQLLNTSCQKELDLYNRILANFVEFVHMLGEEVNPLENKNFNIKIADGSLRTNVIVSLNQLDAIQVSCDTILHELNSLLVQIRTTNTTVVKYQNVVQRISDAL